MKRKFFSVMAAACAALFSFSGLTCCGGGGGGGGGGDVSEGYGIVSADDFRSGKKGFNMSIGTTVLRIMPNGASDDNLEYDDGSEENATVIRTCNLTAGGVSAVAQVTYHVDWPADEVYPVKAEASAVADGSTSGTYLMITMEDTGDTATFASLVRALGGAPDGNELLGSIYIGLDYSSNWCTVSYGLFMKNADGLWVPYPMQSGSGSFYAEKAS